MSQPPAPQPRRRPRAPAALGLLLVVLLLHAALLARLPRLPGAGSAPRPAGALQLRQLRLPAVAAAAAPAPAAVTPPAVLPPKPPKPTSPPAAPRRAAAAPPTGAPAAAQMGAGGVAAAAAASAAAPEGPGAAAAPPGGAGGGPQLPRYATRLPPPVTLQYAVQRAGPGRRGLQAELRWRPAEGRYTLTLGFAAVGWASVGQVDADGVAPERHVETRAGRSVRAVNFQRQPGPGGGRITFSGPSFAYPLLPGVQDRLSWMLQLAAVLAADPALGHPGREVQLWVVGVRGDAAVWAFSVVGREALTLPQGAVVDAVHLRREPQGPYDTRVNVWLDPARHHLPVRMQLQNRGESEGTDFQLLDIDLQP